MSSDALAETDGSGGSANEYVFFGSSRIARRKVRKAHRTTAVLLKVYLQNGGGVRRQGTDKIRRQPFNGSMLDFNVCDSEIVAR